MRDFIIQGKKDGYIISESSFSKEKQLYVFILTKSSKRQEWRIEKTKPEEWIKSAKSKGLAITKIMYNEDTDWLEWPWFVVGTSDSGTCSEVCFDLGADEDGTSC